MPFFECFNRNERKKHELTFRINFVNLANHDNGKWELVSTTDAAQVFIDRETIDRGEVIASVWELQNIGHYASENQSSYRYLSNTIAKIERWMYSTFTKHSGPMATGNILQDPIKLRRGESFLLTRRQAQL